LKSIAFWVDNRGMHLIYIKKTFIQVLTSKPTENATNLLSEALFYIAETNTWQNPFSQSPRLKLEFLKNQFEFNEKKWILLKKSNGAFVQDGPYSSMEIFNFISENKVQLTDPIWTDGFSKWVPIQETANFKALANRLTPAEIETADLLSNVEEYRPQMHRVEGESPSPEASGEVFIILDDK
jgi:hypothetical protein